MEDRMEDKIYNWYFSNYREDEPILDVSQLAVILKAMGFVFRDGYGPKKFGDSRKGGLGCVIEISCLDTGMRVVMQSPMGTTCMCPTAYFPGLESTNASREVICLPRLSYDARICARDVLKSLIHIIISRKCTYPKLNQSLQTPGNNTSLGLKFLETTLCETQQTLREPMHDSYKTKLSEYRCDLNVENTSLCNVSPISMAVSDFHMTSVKSNTGSAMKIFQVSLPKGTMESVFELSPIGNPQVRNNTVVSSTPLKGGSVPKGVCGQISKPASKVKYGFPPIVEIPGPSFMVGPPATQNIRKALCKTSSSHEEVKCDCPRKTRLGETTASKVFSTKNSHWNKANASKFKFGSMSAGLGRFPRSGGGPVLATAGRELTYDTLMSGIATSQGKSYGGKGKRQTDFATSTGAYRKK